MITGTKVKHSQYALKSLRDYWLSCGKEPQKSQAKDHYEAKKAETGIITSYDNKGLTVVWDNGTVSKCLNYMVEPV